MARTAPTMLKQYAQQQLTENRALDEDDDLSEDWDEGCTLVDGLKVFDESPDEKLLNQLAVVDTLKDVMADRSNAFKQEIVDTLVPTLDHVRLVHDYLEDKTDQDYKKAANNFNQACEDAQIAVVHHRDELLEMLQESRGTLQSLFGQLKSLYAERSLLFDIADQFHAILDPALQGLEETAPQEIANLQAHLEKKRKTLFNSDKKGDAMKQIMKAMSG